MAIVPDYVEAKGTPSVARRNLEPLPETPWRYRPAKAVKPWGNMLMPGPQGDGLQDLKRLPQGLRTRQRLLAVPLLRVPLTRGSPRRTTFDGRS